MKRCKCGTELPPRFLVSRCPSCTLLDIAPMTGAERAARGLPVVDSKQMALNARMRMITAALRATAQSDYEFVRAHSADPYKKFVIERP